MLENLFWKRYALHALIEKLNEAIGMKIQSSNPATNKQPIGHKLASNTNETLELKEIFTLK